MSKVAAIQMASGPNIQANLDQAKRLIEDAAKQGAGLVVLPENFALMAMSEPERVKQAEVLGKGVIQKFLAAQAKKHGIWLVGGTIPLQGEETGKSLAASLLFNDKGEQVAHYDKIHMFDVLIKDSGEKYNESQTTEAGNEIIVVDSPFGKIGMAVCYDLRFPELFRNLADKGMDICVLPSAFTAITGKAHWEPLLRARAIENQCYLIAAAQGGFHINGRETHGNSMIVDPWGTVLNRIQSGNGVVVADIDMNFLRKTRKNFPALKHRRINCVIS
jgi:deaminated glutathione amidase